MSGKWWLLLLMAVLLGGCSSAESVRIRFADVVEYPPVGRDAPTLRIGVATLMSPQEGFGAFRAFADYLGDAVDLPADLVMQKSYSELNDLVRNGAVDLAVTGYGGFEAGRAQFGLEALAVGQVDGTTEGCAVLLVRADSGITHFANLEGKSVAFSDPLSQSGHLVLRAWMESRDLVPERYFRQILYTYGQDGSVAAVLGRVTDAAIVDGYQYRAYLSRHPELDGLLRVVMRISTPGTITVIVRPDLPPSEKERYRRAVLEMSQTAPGRQVLAGLLLERFVPPAPEGGEKR